MGPHSTKFLNITFTFFVSKYNLLQIFISNVKNYTCTWTSYYLINGIAITTIVILRKWWKLNLEEWKKKCWNDNKLFIKRLVKLGKDKIKEGG